MNNTTRLNARGANKNGDLVADYLMECEYYFDKSGNQVDTMHWAGKLAGELGLAGKPVDRKDMQALMKGFAPDDGRALCQNAGEEPKEVVKLDRNGQPRLDKDGNVMTKLEGGHRVGFDITFSAPKPFSVAFAIAEGEEKDGILEAHRKAVGVAMEYLESKVETRRGHAGRDVIEVDGLVYSSHLHMANRNLEPNLHTHSLVYGVARGGGKWGTYDAIELYRHRQASDVIFKNELAANMRELGYGIEQERHLNADGKETGRVEYKINGISDDLCKAFSSRSQEIADYMEKHDVSAQAACLATRRHKDEPSYAEMAANWKQTMGSMDEITVPTVEQLKGMGDKLMVKKDDKQILEQLHSQEAYFSDHNLVEVIGQEYAGELRIDQLMEKVEDFKQARGLVRINAETLATEDRGQTLARRHTEDRFAAPWMVQWEQEIVHRVESRKDEDHQKLQDNSVEAAIAAHQKRKGFALSDEQEKAVRHITQETGGVAVVSGWAGTGKTTVSDCFSEAFKAEGRNMMGVCVSNAAARKLESESGMPCVSVAKMLARLEHKRMSLGQDDVLVVDEAGMIDTDQTRQLLAHAQQASCKVIFMGDTMQLQPIGSGSGMSLAKLAVGDVQLTEIRRQAREEDRDLAKLFYRNLDEDGQQTDLKKGTRSRSKSVELGSEILAGLTARNAVDDYDTQSHAIEGLVADYLASPTPATDKLVIGHARVEVEILNRDIRAGLKAKGELPREEVTIEAKVNGELRELELARGDRLRFTDTNEKLGVVNGSQGILLDYQEDASGGGVAMKVRIQSEIEKEDGRIVEFNTNDYKAVAHNYATTVHKAQGASKEQVFHLINSGGGMMDNHSTLVAFTRLTKGDYRMYGSSDDIERLGERFGLERLKGNAITEGIRPAAENDMAHLLEAQSRRADHTEKKQAQSGLTEADTAWIQSHAEALARSMRQEPEQEQTNKRDRDRGQEL